MGLLNNDVVQITFIGSAFNQEIELVRNYAIAGDFPVTNTVATDLSLILTGVATGGVNDIETSYLACLPATYSLTQIKAQRIWPIRSSYTVLNIVGGTPGTNAGAATKSNCTAAILLRTALAGRSQRGVAHIGPTPDAAAAGGLVVGAYQVVLAALLAKLLVAFTPPTSGSLVIPVIYHRKTHTFDNITTGTVQGTSRVQRRRTVGLGA